MEETSNYFIKEIDKNELMSNKYKKVCTTLNYIEHFLVLASAVFFSFASLLGIPRGIPSSAIGLRICVITARIKSVSQ